MAHPAPLGRWPAGGIRCSDPGPAAKLDIIETTETTRERTMAIDPITQLAVTAISETLHDGRDVAEFLAHALCYVAAEKGGIEGVLRNRPDSWEAEHVRALMAGTVGEDGEHLDLYREVPGP